MPVLLHWMKDQGSRIKDEVEGCAREEDGADGSVVRTGRIEYFILNARVNKAL